jgi:hypothetical protein
MGIQIIETLSKTNTFVMYDVCYRVHMQEFNKYLKLIFRRGFVLLLLSNRRLLKAPHHFMTEPDLFS